MVCLCCRHVGRVPSVGVEGGEVESEGRAERPLAHGAERVHGVHHRAPRAAARVHEAPPRHAMHERHRRARGRDARNLPGVYP
eukprot:1076144-Prorocentrum_minimum.AAC.2